MGNVWAGNAGLAAIGIGGKCQWRGGSRGGRLLCDGALGPNSLSKVIRDGWPRGALLACPAGAFDVI